MIGIILAAGTTIIQGKPKAALPCGGGDRLIDRTMRMFRPHVLKMWLVTHESKEALDHPDAMRFEPLSRRWKCDTLLSSANLWSDIDDVLVLHGDVWFDNDADKKMLHWGRSTTRFFWDGKQEFFALYCPMKQHFNLIRCLKMTVQNTAPEAHQNDCSLASLSHVCRAMGMNVHICCLMDQTMDIDTEWEYQGFLKGLRKRSRSGA